MGRSTLELEEIGKTKKKLLVNEAKTIDWKQEVDIYYRRVISNGDTDDQQ